MKLRPLTTKSHTKDTCFYEQQLQRREVEKKQKELFLVNVSHENKLKTSPIVISFSCPIRVETVDVSYFVNRDVLLLKE